MRYGKIDSFDNGELLFENDLTSRVLFTKVLVLEFSTACVFFSARVRKCVRVCAANPEVHHFEGSSGIEVRCAK